MIKIQGLPTTGCNVFQGNYVDNYSSNIRTRYYIYDGQAVASSTSTYTQQPTNAICMTSDSIPLENPFLQTMLIITVIIAVIAVLLSAYQIIIKPFIKVKR